jgi:hypothetical protein
MIKYFCDVCGKEPKDTNFVFEATIAEMRDVYDVAGKNLNPRKQMNKQMIQICRECYEKNIKKLLKI